MDPSFPRLRLRQNAEPSIESWDDDTDLQCINDLHLRFASKAQSRANSIFALPNRPIYRDSISSHQSLLSDSNNGDLDDDSTILLDDDDDRSFSQNALSALQSGSISAQSRFPTSALQSGATKGFGGQELRDSLTDNWADGLDLSSIDGKPEAKIHPTLSFSGSFSSARKSPLNWLQDGSQPGFGSRGHCILTEEKVHDISCSNSQGYGGDTIRASTIPQGLSQELSQSTLKINTSMTGSTMYSHESTQPDEIEDGLELPTDSTFKLALKSRAQDTDRIPDDIDSDWAEGSLGVRHGGTKHEQSSRYSAVYSPSISSRLTIESEDDGLDGLILPEDPSFVTALQRKLEAAQPSQLPPPQEPQQVDSQPSTSYADDFLADFEIDGDDIFDPRRRNSHQNIQQRAQSTSLNPRTTSSSVPNLKPLPSLTTRIPRPAAHHDRSQSAHVLPASILEPVAESGTVTSRYDRSRSQTGNHAQSGLSSGIPLPVSHTATQPTNACRSFAKNNSSHGSPNSSSRYLSSHGLKARRSASVTRAPSLNSSGTPQRPLSRQNKGPRAASATRARTPTDRGPIASRSGSLRRSMPLFQPAGTTRRQSSHVNTKTPAKLQCRTDLGISGVTPVDRSSNTSSGVTNLPVQQREWPKPQPFPKFAKPAMSRPSWRKNFGDGSELDVFEDLPTSASAESKYVKKASKFNTQRSLRVKVSNQSTLSSNSRSTESAPSSPFRSRFARDSNVSRNPRDQKMDSVAGSERSHGVPAAAGSPKPQRDRFSLPGPTSTKHKTTKNNKPHLIRPMGSGVHATKYVKGMRYNPALYRWEGNENSTSSFDTLPSPVAPKVAPALIANVGSATGVQIVNGMVFDPQRMCWMKLARSQDGTETVPVPPEEDEDPFVGLPDLEDKPRLRTRSRGESNLHDTALAHDNDRSGDESDDWPITEEFDVGPEFIRRQRVEEDRWMRKVQRWIRDGGRCDESWRWAIRDIQRDSTPQSPHNFSQQR
ncbi:two-component GAP Byr4 [Ascosphaera apis ARSEF 7405]|uniref:Two-component GAP Byr4 n=1 Tax=Ascosphaera apis ARSEF 7405 TaxID=392613 RepID=A0A167YYU8_9EURO|nr:two-component GAP Byr4 [Ascosphaera apis ARSEF 7405]